MPLEILKVTTQKDLQEFVDLPWKIYKDDPNWVPPLKNEVKVILSTKNPYWKHSEKILYILKDNNETVGRIAGIIDYNYIQFHNQNVGYFGFYESLNKQEYANVLLKTVEEWLKSKDMEKMYGTMNPSTNDEMGFLLEGFNTPPKLMMPHTPKYYLSLMEGYGLKKVKDLYAYEMSLKDVPFERLEKVAKITQKKSPNVVIRKFNTKKMDQEIQNALEVYNSAWEKNWGFVPWTEEEFKDAAYKMKSLFFLGTTLFLEVDNKPAGMLIGVPDYNFVMKQLNGKLGPIEIGKFLWYKRKIKWLRIMILGVKKEHRKKGFEALLYYIGAKNAIEAGYESCEFSWILEDNILTCRSCEFMGGKVYKKYRIFEKLINN